MNYYVKLCLWDSYLAKGNRRTVKKWQIIAEEE